MGKGSVDIPKRNNSRNSPTPEPPGDFEPPPDFVLRESRIPQTIDATARDRHLWSPQRGHEERPWLRGNRGSVRPFARSPARETGAPKQARHRALSVAHTPLRLNKPDDPGDRGEVRGDSVPYRLSGEEPRKRRHGLARNPRRTPPTWDRGQGRSTPSIDRPLPLAHRRGRNPELSRDGPLGPSVREKIDPLHALGLERGGISVVLCPSAHEDDRALSPIKLFSHLLVSFN